MKNYKYLTTDTFNIIKQDIDNVLDNNTLSLEEKIKHLDEVEDFNLESIIDGVKTMPEHINIDKNMSSNELTDRLKQINNLAQEQENVDLSDLSITFSAFLLMIDCDFLGFKFHTENVLNDCKKLFEQTRLDLQVKKAILDKKSSSGATNARERYKGEDTFIEYVINKCSGIVNLAT